MNYIFTTIYSRILYIDGFHMKPMLACVEASHAWVSYIYSMHSYDIKTI